MANIISIDRSHPFDPKTFIGEGWSVEEQDENSLALKEINTSEVVLCSVLKEGGISIGGEDRLDLLRKKKVILLDIAILIAFKEDEELIPSSWKELTNGGTTIVFFDGTILKNPNGKRCVPCLYWSGRMWVHDYPWLIYSWNSAHLSAVLLDGNVAP